VFPAEGAELLAAGLPNLVNSISMNDKELMALGTIMMLQSYLGKF
jgi:hypothetical protein